MERIWLKAEGIQLCNFQRDKEGNAAWASVVVGEQGFAIRGYFFNLEKDGSITQNNATSRMRFCDCPLMHYGKRKPAWLLHDVIAKAIYDFCLAGEREEELRSFLEGKSELKEFPFFTPAEWQGKFLRIPLDYIALRSASSSLSLPSQNRAVYANIELGDHLIFWEQLVFDGKNFCYGGSGARDPRDAIYDEQAVEAINHLLNREDVQKRIHYLSDTGNRDYSDMVFYDKTPDYDEKNIRDFGSLPRPVRFY